MNVLLLRDLAENPGHLEQVSREECEELLSELEAVRVHLWGRLMKPAIPQGPEDGHRKPKNEDRLLTPAEAAEILGVNRKWMYNHADTLPFTHRLSPRCLRFSESGLRGWMETRQ